MRAINSDIGWAMLAAATILSGEQSNDKSFLESDWHDMLHDMVTCFLGMKDFKETTTFVSKSHIYKQN